MGLASRNHSRNRKLVVAGLLGLLCAGLFFILRPGLSTRPVSGGKIALAVPTLISAGGLFVAEKRNLYAEQGLSVTTSTFALGRDALQAVLMDKADLAVLADTPFMFAVMKGEKIAIVATIFASRKAMSVVGRKDRNILRAEDLGGKTIGTMFGTNAQFFLDTLLLANGVPRESVKVVNLAPNVLESALREGRVDAVTAFDSRLAKAIGEGTTTVYGEDLFVYRFVIVGKQSYLDTHPDQVRHLLATLERSNQFIRDEPAQAKLIIGAAINNSPEMMTQYFEPNDFQLSLDQSLLLSLSDQTRWAMKRQLVPVGPVPNYLDYVRQAPLEALRPSANKIFR